MCGEFLMRREWMSSCGERKCYHHLKTSSLEHTIWYRHTEAWKPVSWSLQVAAHFVNLKNTMVRDPHTWINICIKKKKKEFNCFTEQFDYRYRGDNKDGRGGDTKSGNTHDVTHFCPLVLRNLAILTALGILLSFRQFLIVPFYPIRWL